MQQNINTNSKNRDNFILKDIKIGKADGEQESLEKNFMDMFYTGNNKVNELEDLSVFIISGRKGTGKTVLAKFFLENEKRKDLLLSTKYRKLNELSLHQLIEFGDKKIDRKMMFNFQKYYIYTELIETILRDKKSLKEFGYNLINFIKYRSSLKRLENLYNKKYTDDLFEIISLEGTINKNNEIKANLTSSNLGAEVTKNETSSITEQREIKKFYKLLDLFEKNLFEILKYVNVNLVIDDFDDYFIDDKKDLIRFLIDFVNNVKRINNVMKEKVKNTNFKSRCIILMRDDVIESFSNNDANIEKVIIDSRVRLNWNEKKNQNELKNMLFNKIIKSNEKFKQNKIVDIRTIEDMFFPENEKNTSPRSKNFFNRIVEMTFGRPRDVIVLLSIIVKQNKDESRFSFQMIKEASMEYSKHFINELRNEMCFHYDEKYIDSVFRLLADYRQTRFSYEDIHQFYRENSDKYTFEKTFLEIIDDMYKFGIIGFTGGIGKKGKKGYYRWSYFYNSPKNVDINATLVVHKALYKGLNI